MKTIVAILVLSFSFMANASDAWDFCSDASGNVKLEWGTLTVAEIGEVAPESVKVKVLNPQVKKEERNCNLKGLKAEVLAYSNTVSVEEVTFTLEENDPGTTVVLICERGGSGIPAGDSCEE